jgi:hypothetical protein
MYLAYAMIYVNQHIDLNSVILCLPVIDTISFQFLFFSSGIIHDIISVKNQNRIFRDSI